MPIINQQVQMPVMAGYLLLIEPRPDLRQTIMDIKQDFYDTYKAPDAVTSIPHLTLVNFTQYSGLETRIRHGLRQLAMEYPPLFIELMDFGSFPSHTIYINVISRNPIQELVKQIRSHMQSMMKPDKDHAPHFILEPHITIARRLKPWQYEQGWLEYSNRTFSGKFMATSMILLRKTDAASHYKMVERFEFQNIPVRPVQGVMF